MQRCTPSQQREPSPVLQHRTPQRGSSWTHHNASGRAQIKLDHKAVLAGQEGDTRGGHQEVGPGLDGLIRLPSIGQDAEHIQLVF